MSPTRSWTGRLSLAALTLATMGGAALAADMPAPPPPPPPIVEASGWYLRGDIGFSNQNVDKLDNVLYEGTNDLEHKQKGFDAAPFGGAGVGYRVNDWFRVDATGEYRGSANFHGLDTFTFGDGSGNTYNGSDHYSASKEEATFLLNAYLDLGTWYGVTPFIGAGVGASLNRIDNFQDIGLNNLGGPSVAYAPGHSNWDLAYAFQAGLAYEITPNLTLEFAYRYLNVGDARTGDISTYDGTNSVYNPMKFKNIDSNDFKVGLRWSLDPAPTAVAAYDGYGSTPFGGGAVH